MIVLKNRSNEIPIRQELPVIEKLQPDFFQISYSDIILVTIILVLYNGVFFVIIISGKIFNSNISWKYWWIKIRHLGYFNTQLKYPKQCLEDLTMFFMSTWWGDSKNMKKIELYPHITTGIPEFFEPSYRPGVKLSIICSFSRFYESFFFLFLNW